MSGFVSKIKSVYFDKKNAVLLGVPFCMYFVPKAVKALAMLQRKDELSSVFLFAVDELSLFLAMIFLIAGVCHGFKGFFKSGLGALLGSGIWIFAVQGVIKLADILTGRNSIVNLIVYGVIYTILYGFFGARFIIDAADSQNRFSAGKLFGKTFSKLGLALIFGVLLLAVNLINYYLGEVLGGVAKISFALYFSEAFLQVLVFYIIMLPVTLKLKSVADVDMTSFVDAEEEKLPKVFPVGAIISTLVSVILTLSLFFVNNGLTKNNTDRMEAIYGRLESYGILIAACGGEDRYLEASALLDDFYSEIYAWRGILGEDESYIELAKEHMDNPQVGYMVNWYEVKSHKDISGFRNKILSGEADVSDIFAYLEGLKEAKASGEDKLIRNDLILSLALMEKYNDDAINPYSLSNREKTKLEEALSNYEMLADSFLEYRVAAEIIVRGSVDEEVRTLCYELADTHPEDLMLQKMAFNACRQLGMHDYDYSNRSIGMKYLHAYDELFESVYDYDNGRQSLTEEDYILEKLEMASYYIEMNLYDELIEYLNQALKKVEAEEFYDYLSLAYAEMGDSQKALEYLEKIYITDMSAINDADLLFRFGENYIRNHQYQKGIEAFGHMSEVILAMEEPGEYNTYLASAIAMLGNGDKRVDGTERSIYKYDFSDDDREALANYEYLNTMVELEFNYRNWSNVYVKEEELKKLSALDKLLSEKYSNIAYGWYLLANQYYQLESYEEAVEYYKKSLEVYDDQPYCWFSLATLYDYLGDYPNSRRAAEHVILLQHDNSHLNDPYGVTWHTNLLLEKLEKAGY